MSELTCSERVQNAADDRLTDLRTLLHLYWDDPDAYDDDLGNLSEYGLDLSWVQPENGENGYICYLLSTGGPHEEIRFYCGPDFRLGVVEFHLLDWYDHAETTLAGEHLRTALKLWDDWVECDIPQQAFEASQLA